MLLVMNILDVPSGLLPAQLKGQFKLNRYPVRKQENLRAWDAADEYILQYLAEQQVPVEHMRVLILNDAFGGLSIPLSFCHPDSVTDSYISQRAVECNAELNQVDQSTIHQFNSQQPLPRKYDLVLIKIPRSLAMLEYQLQMIRSYCTAETVITGAAMSKHIHRSTLDCFERCIGETSTSLARKKARLVFSQYNDALEVSRSRYPDSYVLDSNNERYINHANVFSREKLDIGSRFLLQHIPRSDQYMNITDLACGNGVIGIAAARANPQAHLNFVDESYMAVESARLNVQNLLGEATGYNFLVTDCLHGIEDDSQDLILNNPPFHQQHAVGDFIAWQMFKESLDKLKKGGELVIVGNRHLAYHIKLKRLFGNCTLLNSNKKFVILKAVKQ